MSTDPLQPLDDPDHPVLTMSQAADLLGVQAAFLRSLDSSGVLHPHRSPGGHRRYSRHQLQLAARVRVPPCLAHAVDSRWGPGNPTARTRAGARIRAVVASGVGSISRSGR